MAPLDRVYNLKAKLDFENNASAEIAAVSAELNTLDQQIERMDSTINVHVDVNTREAEAKLDNFERRIADVSGGKARLDLNTRPAHDSLDRIERRLIAFAARTYRAAVDLNVNGLPGVIAANAALRRIPARRTSTVNVNTDQGVGALRRLTGATNEAASGGQFMASIFGSRVMGVSVGILLAGILAILPILGPLAAGLTTAAVTAGSAAIGFGLVGGAIARMVMGIKEGEVGFEGIQAAIDEFKAVAMDAFLPAALQAARFGSTIIGIGTRAMPLLGNASRLAVLSLETGFNRAWEAITRNNRVLNNFKQVLGDSRTVVRLLTEAFTHFGAGFIGFLAASSPQIIQFATYIRDIARRFSEWANSAQGRAQIQAFLRSAAPVARALAYAIWRVGGALINLGIKHGPTAARGIKLFADGIVLVIRIMDRVLTVVERLIRAWDRLSPATRRNILSWAALVAQIIIARAAIGLVIGVLSRLVGAFVGPIRGLLNFTRGLLGFRRATGGAATAGRILRTVLSALFHPIRTLQALFARLVTIKWRVADAARRVGTAIRNFFGGALRFVRGLITGFNNLLLRLWGVFSRGVGRIRDLAVALRNFLGTAFRAATTAARNFIGWLGRVSAAVGRGIVAVQNFARNLLTSLGPAIRGAIRWIGELARTLATRIWSGVQAAGRAIMTLGRFLGPYITPIVRALGQVVLWLGRAALMGLLSPVGLVVVALAALGLGLWWAWNYSETFRNGLDKLITKISGGADTSYELGDASAAVGAAFSDNTGLSYLWTDGLDNLITYLSDGEDSSYNMGDASYYVGEAMTDAEGISWIWTAGLDNVISYLSDGEDASYEFGDASYYVGEQMTDAEGISWLWTAGLDNVISSLSEGEDSSYELGDASTYVGEMFTDAEGLSYLWTDALGDVQSALQTADTWTTTLAESIGGWLTDAFWGAVDTAWSMAEGVVAAAKWMYDAVVGSSYIPDMATESIDWMRWWNETGSEQATSLADTAVAETQRMLAAWNEAYESYLNWQSYQEGGNYVDSNRVYHMGDQQIQLRDDSQDPADVKQWNNLPDDWRAYYYKMDLIPQSLRDNTFYEDYSVQNDKIYNTIIDPYERAYDTVVGNSIVPDMVKGVNRWLGHMADDGDRHTRRWAENVTRNFQAVSDAETTERTLPQIRGLDDPFKEVRNDFSDSFGDITKVGETEFERLREVVTDQTVLMRRATRDETEDLYRDMDRIFKSTFESGDQNFRLLRQNSTRQVTDMGNETTRQMDDTSRKMIQSLTEAQQQGNAQLSTLRSYGGATMRAADPEFRYPIGEAASGVQQYLNDMLYGMAQVIDAASLNLTPPKEFQVRLSGAAAGGHGGDAAADWGELANFVSQGKVGWDDGRGGVSGPGQSYLHWWGEGEDANSTEYYIVHGRQDNRPIVEQAAQSLGLTVHDHRENDEERFHPNMMNLFANGGLRGFAHGYTMWEDMWDSRTAQIARQTEAATGAVPNTYSTHPDGYEYRAPYSIDWWGAYGRGDPIGESLGDEVLSYVLSNFASELSYYIWNYNDSWGGSVAAYDSHWDHVHGTFMGAGPEGPGGGSGAPRINLQRILDTYMPGAQDFGASLPEQEATEIGAAVRSGILDALRASTGSTNYDPNGSVMDWIQQGVIFGNVFDPNDQGVLNTLYGRAMQESTGNPNAVNDWDINAMNGTPSKGLFQIIGPTWETHRAMYGEDAGAFEPNWSNPVLSTGVATRYMDNVYGGPVGSGSGGYTNGGIATAMQMALVAEKGPELFIPLHDTRAVQLLFDQIVDWRGASEMNEPVVARFEAEQAVSNARQPVVGTDKAEIRRLGDRLEVALSKQVDARITNVEEMVDVAVEAAVGAQESPAGRNIQARNRAREYQNILDRRR